MYGHLVPNSVVDKSGTEELFSVVSMFLMHAGPVVVLAPLGAVLARGRQRLLLVSFAVYLAGSIGTLDRANA